MEACQVTNGHNTTKRFFYVITDSDAWFPQQFHIDWLKLHYNILPLRSVTLNVPTSNYTNVVKLIYLVWKCGSIRSNYIWKTMKPRDSRRKMWRNAKPRNSRRRSGGVASSPSLLLLPDWGSFKFWVRVFFVFFSGEPFRSPRVCHRNSIVYDRHLV